MSMMYKVLNAEETQDLKWELHSDLPGSAKIFYILSNHVDGLLTGFEVIVDEWPHWKSILLRPQSFDSVPRYFRYYHMCHTKSTKDFKFFIQRPGVVDWDQPIIFTGIPYDAVPVLQEKSRKAHGEVATIENRFMYAWTKTDPPEPAVVPEGLQLTTVNREHAEAICDHWKHYRSNDGLVEYFRLVTEHFDNSAIVTEDGKLVAYICMQFNGSMANLFVDPAYHHLNLGVILLKDLTRKLLDKHHTAFGFIKTKDSDFIHTCQNIGFSWVAQGSMSWVHHRPKSLNVKNGSISSTNQVKSPCSGTVCGGCCPGEGEDGETTNLFLNALPLSCNECSGIPAQASKTGCLHVTSR